MLLSEFQYELPEKRIAQDPVEPRDSSRLLEATGLQDHRFTDLPGLLNPGDLVVINDTRVRHARLHGTKRDTGGAVEVLLLSVLADGGWEALIRPARRIHMGTVLEFGDISATVASEPIEGKVRLELSSEREIEEAIREQGEVPLPPYITSSLDRPDRYQTIFAREVGSAAAPTAGLHFTESIMAGLKTRGIGIARVDLQVGLATFRPINTQRIDDHEMHVERFHIPVKTTEQIAVTRNTGGRVVAIGTTVVRALESAGHRDGSVSVGPGDTELFLKPGSRFNIVDRLVTNFHMPGSSLLVLLAGFMGSEWRAVYETAIERQYRFLSFGDAMLCDRI